MSVLDAPGFSPRTAARAFGRVDPKDILEGLTPAEREHVQRVGRRLRLRADALLYAQGDPPGSTYFVQRGMVRTFRTSRSGRQFTVGFWGEREIIGGPDVFTGEPRLLSAQTTTPSELIGFSERNLDALIGEVPRFARNLVAALSFKSRWAMSTSNDLGTGRVPQRLAQVILIQSEVHGERAPDGASMLTHVSHEDLAKLVGASRQWVTKALADLQRRGIIRVARRRIVVLDEQRLAQLAAL
ncbi:MAG TPA: Crp/Fnr family transcriptional regulator [Solirubrobacteraceae bacterium]|jgi:CRP-like cAMP-binding protein